MEHNDGRISGVSYPRPNSNGYVPRPLDPSSNGLSEKIKLVGEQLACNSHDIWGKTRIDQGWSYGPERNDQKKTNPCMVFYDELPEADKADDRATAYSALRFIMSKGYKIKEKPSPSMEEMVRIAWTDHGRDEKQLNFGSTVYIGLFGTGNVTDRKQLSHELHQYFKSLYRQFGQEKALSGGEQGKALTESSRYKKYAHTRFAALSTLSTEAEQIAATVAAGYGITTYKVLGGGQPRVEGDTIYTDGDAISFICDHSLFALAMWDGIKGSDPYMELAVNRALKGSRSRLGRLDMPDNIYIDHMLLPSGAGDNGGRSHKLYKIRTLYPYPLETGHAWYFRDGRSKVEATDKYNCDRFQQNIRKIIQYNRTVKERKAEIMASTEVYDLLPGLHGHTETDRDLLRHLFADKMSMLYQNKRNKNIRRMTLMAVLGLLCSSLISDAPDILFGVDLSSFSAVLGGLLVAFFIAAIVFFAIPYFGKYHEKYVDFRLMSECLRVQTYWKAAGVRDEVGKAFGPKSKLDHEWVRYVLRSWELSNSMYMPQGKSFSPNIINEVKKIWCGSEDDHKNGEYSVNFDAVASQYVFSRNKARYNREKAARQSRFTGIFLAAAFALTIVTGILAIVGGVSGKAMDVMDYVILLAGLLQIGSAGYAFYNTSRDYNRLANNYTHLCIEYQKSILAYSMADNDEERLAVLHATGQEAVREACVWAYESGNNEPTPPIS